MKIDFFFFRVCSGNRYYTDNYSIFFSITPLEKQCYYRTGFTLVFFFFVFFYWLRKSWST